GAWSPGERRAAGRREGELVGREEPGEDRGGGAAGDAVGGGVLGQRGRIEVALPRPIGGGGVVAVGVTGADGGDGAPEVVEVARVGAGDVAVGGRRVHEGEEPRLVPAIETALGGGDARDPAPALRRALVPVPGDLGLHRAPHRAAPGPQPVHLVVIARVAGGLGRRRVAR